MKRGSKKAGPAVLVTELPRNPEEVRKRSDAFALAEAYANRAIESGEPISPDLIQIVSDLSPGGAAKKLLEAIPVIQGNKKRTANLHEGKGQAYENRRRAALNIAARLMRKDRRLQQPRKTSEIARLVWAELPQTDEDKRTAVRTIRRWIADWLAGGSTPKK
jgi:hypothetical protein